MKSQEKDILDCWPFEYEPRPNQIKSLTWLAEQKAKYLILEAPVGAGKSNIGVTYSLWLGQYKGRNKGHSFIMTPQRILQEQYDVSFRDVDGVSMASLYGKANYDCASKNASCDIGGLVKPKCNDCPHTKAKKRAQMAGNTVLNYKLALTSFAYTDIYKPRTLMVLDECHTLENHLIDFDALALVEWRCKKYKIKWSRQTTLQGALTWLRDVYVPKIKDALIALEDECEPLFDKPGTDLTASEIRKLRDMDKLADHVGESTEMSLRTLDYVKDRFVLVHDKVMMQFKRLTGAHSFDKIMNPMADRFLFMSSTVLNKDGFCRDLGIDPKDAAFLSLDSEFPEDKRPVFYIPQMKMNAKWVNDENIGGRRRLANKIFEILEMHKEHTGIIHTGNFAIAQWLVDELEGEIPHQIFHHNPGSDSDRNVVINSFTADPKPSLLISPSITEGLDLKDDLGRFAIFAKVPFGYLGDQWIRRRMDMSNEWYQRRALIDIIQGGGRIVRSADDWGNVYLLDQSFAYLYKQTYHMIPQWWRDAYRTL